jgi:16S rRNA (guanine966-N2)-methyltransferase
LRIIGGEFKGRRLFAPDGRETRPTADRVRESLFNIIRNRLPGACVLDLFAGSGALSLEAVSLGAELAVACDSSKEAEKAIRRNVCLCGASDRVRIVASDWRGAVSHMTDAFDVVFLDPPYRMREAYREAIEALKKAGLLKSDALIAMEYMSKEAPPPIPEDFVVFDTRRYGDTSIAFVRARKEDAPC